MRRRMSAEARLWLRIDAAFDVGMGDEKCDKEVTREARDVR